MEIGKIWENPHKIFLAFVFIATAILLFSHIALAETHSPKNTTLENGYVKPENGPWGEEFTFKITYRSPNDIKPPKRPIKLHINEMNLEMSEDNHSDENMVDGKVYSRTWKSSKNDIGSISFYFSKNGDPEEKIRYPENENIKGPSITCRVTEFVDFEISQENGSLLFSGTLRDKENLDELPYKKIKIIEVLEENSELLSEATTEENGYFEGEISNFEPKGVSRIEARLDGNHLYKPKKSEPQFITSLRDLNFVIPSIVLIVMLFSGAIFFLPKEEDYPALIFGWAVMLSIIFVLFLSRIFSGFVPGVILGVLIEKHFSDWRKIPLIGAVGGVLATGAFSSMSLISIVLGRTVEVQRSFTPISFALNHFIPISITATIIMALGMALGTLLGLFFKKIKVMF